jgi:hypothetical protein
MFGIGFTFCHLWAKHQQLQRRRASPPTGQSPPEDNDENDDDAQADRDDDDRQTEGTFCSPSSSACRDQITITDGIPTRKDSVPITDPLLLPLIDELADLDRQRAHLLGLLKQTSATSQLRTKSTPPPVHHDLEASLEETSTPVTSKQNGNAFAFSENAQLLPTPPSQPERYQVASPGHYRKFSGVSAWPSELPQNRSETFVSLEASPEAVEGQNPARRSDDYHFH